ncbi:hypothetical protein [Pseudoflavitalea rhizosphaerae]|uniref:hypothetical protein n=1 Tax=Pseudoflavitalea rhizosphaerae TaxID=1884793 RepID=UPI000F8E2789|nr:hypothetical protein [Pseudoflavitalea rhizosphaerae]
MGFFILLLILIGISLLIIEIISRRLQWVNAGLLRALLAYHWLFAVIYYWYVQSAASDSVAYYNRTLETYYYWKDAYGTGTPFIDFLSYPFIHFLGFTYEMMMLLFAWFGYWGFVCFYIIFKEHTRFKHTLKGINIISLFMFLPNMHYWTASLGKGSIIFFGLGLTMYGLSKLKTRKLAMLIGLLIVYHVRPHIFFVMAVAILTGLVTAREKIPLFQKLVLLAGVTAAILILYDNVMAFASLDSEDLFGSFDELASHRSVELAKAGSGIDVSGYPFPLRLFTFWYRPLFFDAPGPMGIIVSFENLLYLFMTAKLFNIHFINFFRASMVMVKSGMVAFLATSLALSGTLSNLGIIIRQKSMVMYFLLLVILAFLDYLKARESKQLPAVAPKTNTHGRHIYDLP